MQLNLQLPSQTVSMSEKLKKGTLPFYKSNDKSNQVVKSWGEQTVDYYISLAMQQETSREELYTLARLKEGVIMEQDYNHILNPLNTENPAYRRLPAKLRCYNIIKPVIEEFIGERTQRPLDPIVVIGNKEADNFFKQQLIQSANGVLQQQFINMLNAMGINTGVDSQEVPNIEDHVKMFTDKWDSTKAQETQDIISLISKECELDEKYQLAYEHWLVYGRVITHTTVVNDELEYEIVPPVDAYFPLYQNVNDISDCKWVCRKFDSISLYDVLDKLQDKLDTEDVKWLESLLRIGEETPTQVIMSTQRDIQPNDTNAVIKDEQRGWNNDGIRLWHVNFKTPRKVGLLFTLDELGQPIEIEVDETYRLDKAKGDISLKWYYITQTWEGYRIENTNQTEFSYFAIAPLVVQRTEISTNQKAKLGYGGRYRVDIDGKIISEVKTGYPYQVLFNTFHFQFEKIMNKNKEKIMMIPMGMIPSKPGWDIDKFMYYMDSLSLGFFDETKPNALAALQGLKAIDMGLSQYAGKMVEFLSSIRQEFWDAVGMNRQRYGSTQSSDGKAVNEQAIFHASLITAETNRKFDKFIEREYQTLIDWSKVAWINGKRASFVRSDGSKAILNVNPEEHLGTNYNIFVKNSAEEYRKLKTMENMALNILQNGGKGSDVASILDAGNMTKITKILKDGEAIQRDYEKSLEDARNQTSIKVEELKVDTENSKQETEMYKADRLYDATIDKENLITDREMMMLSIEGKKDNNLGVQKEVDDFKKVIEFRKQELNEKKHSDLMKDKIRNTDIKEKMANKPKPTK
jgi:hypothetical protein